MSSIMIHLFYVMLRRFKRCSQATGVQDPNVGMLVILMMNCLWTVPYNVPAIMFDCNYVQLMVKFGVPLL
jgi:hypothetical protein